MDIPGWKKELLERKHQNKIAVGISDVGGSHAIRQLSSSNSKSEEADEQIVAAAAVFHLDSGKNIHANEKLKMVEKRNSGEQSSDDSADSAEELQYGPGIVNKLKSRYLSLTLREPKIKSRPSILRRATSLENILDEEVEPKHFERQPVKIQNGRNSRNRYNASINSDSLKRARSVETLLRCESSEVIVIENPQPRVNRPKRIQPLLNETERPPVDVVKSKLKIFESTANRKLKKPVGDVAIKVDKFKNIIDRKKPVIKPKPVVEPRVRKLSEIKIEEVDAPIKCTIETPKPTEELIIRPNISKITELFEKSSLHIETESSLSPQSSVTTLSPTSYDFIPNDEIFLSDDNSEPPVLIKHITKPSSPPPQPPLDEGLKLISRNAIDNISKASTTVLYRFDNIPAPPAQQNGFKKPPPLPKVPPRTILPKTVPAKILEPLKIQTSENNLSFREIEKNLINRVKTEQSKNEEQVKNNNVFSESIVKSEVKCVKNNVSGGNLWEQKPWHQQQSNTMVFNFSNRKDVPDYIENDGIIRRPKREKPKPGEGGIILLADAPEDESCTDDFDDRPPSPCDVEFENDNILIEGKSSFSSKLSKRQKLKLQFDDNATSTFEYPSESSLMEESSLSPSTPAILTANNNTGSTTVSPAAAPSPLGTLLQNYQPSKLVLSNEYFQLGVTRSTSPAQQQQSNLPTVPPRSSSPQQTSLSNNYDESDYLKPANDVDNITWGSETVADLLF